MARRDEPDRWVVRVRATSPDAYGGGLAEGFWVRHEVDGALVDRWLAGTALARAERGAAHPVLWLAARMSSARLVRVRGVVPEVAPRPLRPAARLARRVVARRGPVGRSIAWAIEHGVRLRYGQVVVVVPDLVDASGIPVAVVPRLWSTRSDAARQDAAVLGLDARSAAVRVDVGAATASARVQGSELLALDAWPDQAAHDPLLALSGHALRGLEASSAWFALAIAPDAERRAQRARLRVAAGALPELPAIDAEVDAVRARYSWVVVGPHPSAARALGDPALAGSLLGADGQRGPG